MSDKKDNPFAKSEGTRVKITKDQEKQIEKLYKDVAKDVDEQAKFYARRNNAGSMLRTVQLNDLKNNLKDSMQNVDSSTQRIIRGNMLKMSQTVFNDNSKLLKNMGFVESDTRYAYVPRDIVNQLVSGQLYQGNWSLSKSIWNNNAIINHDLDSIVAKGIAENKSTYEIAKDLERYVNPSRAKPWDWGKVYPGTKKVIDYNAQRLARTMVSHAYEESFVRATKENPFIESYQWLASGGDRMCEICAERDGKIFAKDELPFDHPNGMCTFIAVIEKSYEEIGRDLANWVNGEGNQELNKQLDGYAEDLYLRDKVAININDLNKAQFVNSNILKNNKPEDNGTYIKDGKIKYNGENSIVDNEDIFAEAEELGYNPFEILDKLEQFEESSYGGNFNELSNFIYEAKDLQYTGNVYRGLSFNTEKEYKDFIDKYEVGSKMKFNSSQMSWSMDKEIAKDYSKGGGKEFDKSVILINNNKGRKSVLSTQYALGIENQVGADINGVWHPEAQVLYSTKADLVVEKVEKGKDVTYIYVKERLK